MKVARDWYLGNEMASQLDPRHSVWTGTTPWLNLSGVVTHFMDLKEEIVVKIFIFKFETGPN